MICTIHQPNFLPYLGFFNKFKQADVFVLYDTAQYSKNDYHNRNQIKVGDQGAWITIPVSIHLGDLILEAKIANRDFVKKHLGLIQQTYRKAPFFKEIYADLEKIYLDENLAKLTDINTALLKMIFKKFDPAKKIISSSELSIDRAKKSTDGIIEICRSVGCDTYISGGGARSYLDEARCEKEGLKIIWQKFNHPVYTQFGKEFVPNLSIIDGLFHLGYENLYKLI
ncbi:WbqC family protein [Candidatus Parcubacteria bacterium]|nr:WbqC family protein [Patescibacteria group bacterium]MBU4309250.1 WbqC family protein [Patescibacteria group bacterium]MBU4577611.1 WbqC family protein [Patescibacteria group bacterium]MCG2697298.1 WbqC family protein [Candidatus Parcubacteria bacterium]